MVGGHTPRFKSCQAALCFYFGASELLMPNVKPGVFSRRRPSNSHPGPDIVQDLVALDSCFHGMNEVHVWLLCELYAAVGFGARPRPVADLFEAARYKFPKQEWTLRRIAQFRREALKIFEAHLMRGRLM
jgi:hypothetical protein